MSIIKVPGARLAYETQGGGPLMLMVPGANGTADVFKKVAQYLAASYTVVTYDRRGFSRSQLDGLQDYDHRLETDADDVRRLIEHLNDGPATVFGCSSGAVVALETLAYHPAVIHTLIPFEPAAVRQLSNGQKWVDFFFELYDLYRQSGVEPALEKFREQAFTETDRQAMSSTRGSNNSEQMLFNATYWFEHELRQYPAVDLSLDVLKAHADQIVLVVGRESRGYPCYEVNMELGKKLGRNVVELPGGHIGFVTHPVEFAHGLLRTLK